MRLILQKEARKGLKKMGAKAADAMMARLETIAESPRGNHANVKPLAGYSDTYRLRQGDWRAVYRLEWADDEMQVIVIDVRGRVYR
jgi:mRNA interferase RelE/StbE